jgi:C1A family cysteine protease
MYYALRKTVSQLPKSINLIPNCPPVYNQEKLGSCTGNAIAGAVEFELMKQNIDFTPSRLFIYYNERVMENSVNSDCGAQIRDGIKSVASQGVCHETLWPYDETQFATKPTDQCYTEALNYLILQYHSVPQDLVQMKSCLAEGFPFALGITVYESFEGDDVAKTGMVNLPDKNESCVGGHAILCVGYDDAFQRFTIRNSWGTDWGQSGYFTLPYEYVLNPNLADDFWTIRLVK